MIRVTDEGMNPVMTALADRLVVAWQKAATQAVASLTEIWASTYTSMGKLVAGPYLLHYSSILLNGQLDIGLAWLDTDTLAAAIIRPHNPTNPTVPNRDVDVIVFNRSGFLLSGPTMANNPAIVANRQNPTIASTPHTFAVVWSGVSGARTGFDIGAQRFSFYGERIGGQVDLSTETAGETATRLTAIPNGFALTWTHHGPTEARLRFFDHQLAPTTAPIRVGSGPSVVQSAVGPDRLFYVWRENGTCLGRFFNFTGFPLTDSFPIANGTDELYWPHSAFFDGRYLSIWTDWSDDRIYGRWFSETGAGDAAFPISPQPTNRTRHPRAYPVSFDTGTAVAWENSEGVNLRLFREPETTTTLSSTSSSCPPCSCPSMTEVLLTRPCPTVTAGEVVTFVPSPAGISGVGIAGWVISAVLLAIAMGLGGLLIRRKTAPARDEEQRPQYASLPPARTSDGSHYVGLNVINEGHDKAVHDAIELLTLTGHQISRDGQAVS